MRATILIDNIPSQDLAAEWGLSVYIEYNGHVFLLDTGASSAFADNADALGLDLSKVEYGALSHAHYDHADGMDTFFARNASAPFYLRKGCDEGCYGSADTDPDGYHYIGIKKGLLKTYADRIRYAEGKVCLIPNVYLIPHSTPGLEACGEAGKLYWTDGKTMRPDDFRHEQSLIFDTDQGLVLFNSCCHSGADVVVQEAIDAFPGRPIDAIVGGFHLYQTPPEEVLAFAKRLEQTGVRHIVTGHCTGQPAFDLLKQSLGDRVQQLHTGLVLEF